MTAATDDLRIALLTAAERLLVASPANDIATRAVCEAAGVTQPVLYRLFGDKNGLLDALADRGLQRYAHHKAELVTTTDPVADLRTGWDDHMEFARNNPGLYQLMFVPRTTSRSTAREAIFELVVAALTRCAAVGVLRIEPHAAARLILSANVGLAINRIAQPDLFAAQTVSDQLRDSIFAAVLSVGGAESPPSASVATTALQLRAQLALTGTDSLADAEVGLLDLWLQRLSDSG